MNGVRAPFALKSLMLVPLQKLDGLQGAEREYAQLIAAHQTRYVPGWPMALAAVGLSRPAEAIQHLTRAAREREPALVFLKTLPLFDALKEFEEVNRIQCLVGPQ